MAIKGHGVIFEVGDEETVADSETWTKIAKVIDITPPNVESDDIDCSHMESPEQFAEYDPGWAEAGECTLTIQFAADENERVYGLFRQKKGFRMVFNQGSRWQFNGYIKAFGNEVDRKGIITAPITVKISGKPEFVKNPPTP